MAKIITYKNEGAKGVFCQLKLESGERILISMTQKDTKIFKLGLMGLVPVGTVWESSDIEEMIRIFANPTKPEQQPLEAIIEKLIECKSIEEVKLKIVKEKPIEQKIEKRWEQFKGQSNTDATLMDINEIIRKYGGLLEDLGFMIFGAPDSLLPCPKTDVEDALLALAIHDAGEKDQFMLNTTTSCYVMLSRFIPYEKYNVVKVVYGSYGISGLQKENEEIKNKFFLIQNEILTDMEERAKKFILLVLSYPKPDIIPNPSITDLVAAHRKFLEDFKSKLKMNEIE